MTINTTTYAVTDQARDAGRNVVHTVHFKGEVVGTRRSAHRYNYAICKWIGYSGDPTNPRRPYVTRWSRTGATRSSEFAVALETV